VRATDILFEPEELPNDLATLVDEWDQYTKIRLMKNQSRFVEDCAKANDTLQGYVSCGNTMLCFMKLVNKDKDVRDLIQVSYWDYYSAIKGWLLEAPLVAGKWAWRMTHKVVSGVKDRFQKWWQGEEQEPLSFDYEDFQWDKRQLALSVTRTLGLHAVDRLEAELAKEDDQENLPRIFIPYLEWHDIETGAMQNHIFAIVKKNNTNFRIVQGYIAGSAEPGYDLKDWMCSRNIFARPGGFAWFTMDTFIRGLKKFVSNSGPSGAFDGANHADLFLVREVGFVNKSYTAVFVFGEVSEVSSGTLVHNMVQELSPQSEGGDIAEEDEFCNEAMVHDGKRLPGETLLARPGSDFFSLPNKKQPEALKEQPEAIDIYNNAHHHRAENLVVDLYEDEAPVEIDKLESFH